MSAEEPSSGLSASGSLDHRGSYLAVVVSMKCELSQEYEAGPFTAALIRREIRWRADDPVADVGEKIICEIELHFPMPNVFAAVEHWLMTEHQLFVAHSTWQTGDTGPGTGVVVLLFASLFPCATTRHGTTSRRVSAGGLDFVAR